MAGCNTAVSNIVMSLVVLLTLELITPLFKYTPKAIISSIIISAVIGLIDIEAVILIWKVDKFDFVACMGAFFGVVFKSVEIGLLIAVRSNRTKLSAFPVVNFFFLGFVTKVCQNRFQFHLLKYYCKWRGQGLPYLENYPGPLFTGTFNNILRLQRFQASWLLELIQQFTFPTPITSRRGIFQTSSSPGIRARTSSNVYLMGFCSFLFSCCRILRWLTDEEEHLEENNLPRIQFLIVEMSRKKFIKCKNF